MDDDWTSRPRRTRAGVIAVGLVTGGMIGVVTLASNAVPSTPPPAPPDHTTPVVDGLAVTEPARGASLVPVAPTARSSGPSPMPDPTVELKDGRPAGPAAPSVPAATLPSPAASSPTSPARPPAPGGFWLSGGSRNLNKLSAAYEWAEMRGRPVTFATVFSTRDAGWEAFVQTHGGSGQIAAYTDKSMTLLIQTPPFPKNVGASYEALIAGAYDTYWQRIGTVLRQREAQGYPPVIVSIGWEMNGEFMYWGGGSASHRYTNPAQFVAAYRRIVSQLRVTYPQVQTAWVINAHGTPAATGTTDSFAFYPGDDVVTYIGSDDYDHYPPAPTREAFDVRASRDGGLYWLANHARAHGKRIVIPEWGLSRGSHGGGDNPTYIQCMWDTFQRWHAEGLLYAEYYFADPIDGSNVDSDLVSGNPASRARYAALW